MTESCPFCEPDRKRVFHEGTRVLGLWDGFPVAPGHALLVTRRHVSTWFDATTEERTELAEATLVARRIIEQRHGARAFNVGMNCGEAAGQTVMHLHVHVIPRRDGDVEDPRGGIRHVIPGRGNYLVSGPDGASAVREAPAPPAAALPRRAEPGLTGGPDDPLLPHLVAHLDRASEADLVSAFVTETGLAALEQPLRHFLARGGRLRLLTGDYLDFTQPRALRRLLDMADFVRTGNGVGGDRSSTPARVQLRVFETGASTAFHPKAYLFRFTSTGRDEDGLAYVGSSNLTISALRDGWEWNYRVVPAVDRTGFASVEGAFERLFGHPSTRELTSEWIDSYAGRRRFAPTAVPTPPDEPPPEPPPEPHDMQREALAALEATRSEGNAAGLVVMATGLGKTWLAAFDVERLGARRVLFVAHRAEILRQARATFRRILPDARLGLYSGEEKVPEADVLFASIQTLGRLDHLERFGRRAFDHVIIDEFHHAAAKTYLRVIDHFDPEFLLGLTATPQRTDGGDLLALCGENLVYRCDLFEAIRRAPDRLVPFHYFGVPDEVDFRNIPWRGQRFDEEALTQAVETRSRADNALEQWRRRGGTRTLGFCCSQRHADFMAEHFLSNGVRARAVHAGPTSGPRSESLEALEEGELDAVFAVDILNEGVDLPQVDTVLMLRPTESRIVFLQQLGRGLRAAADKQHLTVVDYIGNHRSFLLKPQSLFSLGPGGAEIERALTHCLEGSFDELGLPPGCEVTYELEAVELLRAQLPRRDNPLAGWYEEFEQLHGHRPRAVEAFHEGRNPRSRSVRKRHGSWLRFVGSRGGLDQLERDVLNEPAAGAFLEELEYTSMTRSFKMLTLLALLRREQLPGAVDLDDLTIAFADLARRSARLRADIGENLEDQAAMRRYLERNPVAAWCNEQRRSQRVFFRVDEGRLVSTFTVGPRHQRAFAGLARELVEWRLADYLARGGPETAGATRITCKVLRNQGNRPILKLPDRGRFVGIPEGETPVVVEGGRHEARFVKEFVNVLRREGERENVLPDVMQRWFGEDAGRRGSLHFVAFERVEDGWRLEPLAPGEGSRPAVTHAERRSGALRVHDESGERVDAGFQVRSTDDGLSVVVESRGGTEGSEQARNTEYALGLELLLSRLKKRRAVITDILLDTQQTRNRPLSERRLTLRGGREYPLRLADEQDASELRRAISAAQGRNPTRRIRLELELPEPTTCDELARTLAGEPASSQDG